MKTKEGNTRSVGNNYICDLDLSSTELNYFHGHNKFLFCLFVSRLGPYFPPAI